MRLINENIDNKGKVNTLWAHNPKIGCSNHSPATNYASQYLQNSKNNPGFQAEYFKGVIQRFKEMGYDEVKYRKTTIIKNHKEGTSDTKIYSGTDHKDIVVAPTIVEEGTKEVKK